MRVRGKKNTLAKMLLKHRIDNDLRCEDMAKMLGMTKQQYNRYEHSNEMRRYGKNAWYDKTTV